MNFFVYVFSCIGHYRSPVLWTVDLICFAHVSFVFLFSQLTFSDVCKPIFSMLQANYHSYCHVEKYSWGTLETITLCHPGAWSLADCDNSCCYRDFIQFIVLRVFVWHVWFWVIQLLLFIRSPVLWTVDLCFAYFSFLFFSPTHFSPTSANRYFRNFPHDVALVEKEALLCRFPKSAP